MRTPPEHAATVSSKGQVVIPLDIRRRLGITEGSVLRFLIEDAGVRLLPAEADVRQLKGRLPKPAQSVSLQDMNKAVAERRARLRTG